MAEYQEIEKYLENTSNIWRKYGFDPTQYTGCMLYIMCLKKMIEEKAGLNPNYMGKIVELTRVLYRPISTNDIEVIRKSTEILEETYGVKSGLLTDVLNPLRHQEEAWKEAFLEIINATSEIVADEDGYFLYASKLIYNAGKGKGHNGNRVSSNAVAELLSVAANVRNGEIVLDGAIGYGYSAMKCIEGKKNITLYGVEINTDSIQVATLLMILKGDVKFEVMQEDFTAMMSFCGIDKVVMDMPFGMRATSELVGYQWDKARRWMDSDSCKEMECLFMASALETLNEKGRFVTIVPQGILFKQAKALSSFRRNLIKKGMLKAVISLPSVYNSTSINTTMLVFERNNKDVLFVDASLLISRERRNDAVITAENKEKLSNILEGKKEVEGISFLVPNEKVLEVGDWSIARYQNTVDGLELRSVSEINKELEQHYKRLDELNAMCKEINLFS